MWLCGYVAETFCGVPLESVANGSKIDAAIYAPKNGVYRAPNTAKPKETCVSLFFNVIMRGLGGLNYSQMAN